MALETATYIDALVTSNPDGADARSTADDHLRLIKAALKRSFPQIGGAVSASAVALSYTNDLSRSAQAQLNELRDGSATAKAALVATTCISASSAQALAGVAGTSYARLDQANTFQGGRQEFVAGTPRHLFQSESAAATYQGWYSNYADSDGALKFGTTDDSLNPVASWLVVSRVGTAVNAIAFTGVSITFNGQALDNPIQLNSIPAASFARLDVAQTFQGGIGSTPVTATEASTVTLNMASGDYHRLTLTASRTMGAPANARPGQTLVLRVTQGGSGSYTLTWNSVFRFAGGTAPTLTTTAGAHDVFAFIYDDLLGYWLQAGLDVKR